MYLRYLPPPGNGPGAIASIVLQFWISAQWENIDLRRALLGDQATIDRHDVPCDVTSILRCQKGHRSSKVFGFANPSKWDRHAPLSLRLWTHTLRINRARSDCAHANAIRSKIQGHRTGQRLHPTLCRVIGRQPPMRARRSATGYINNHALMLAGHDMSGTRRAKEDTFEIDRENAIPPLFIALKKVPFNIGQSDVIDQHIHRAKTLKRQIK